MNNEVRFSGVWVHQKVGEFIVGKVDAVQLFQACKFDFRRIEERGGYKEFLGFQRKLDLKRVGDIKKYIGTVDAVFPTSIVIAVDSRTISVRDVSESFVEVTLKEYGDPEQPDLRIEFGDIVSIIDGQHRMKAFEDYRGDLFEVSVAIFVDIDDATKAEIFSTVNLTQTKVNKSLVYDLFGLQKSRSPEKTCHEIVVALDSMEESPFKDRIKRLGTRTDTRGFETLSQATIVRGILPYITDDALRDRDVGKRIGFWDPATPRDTQKRIFFPFFERNEDERILANILNYFNAVKQRWSEAWDSTGRGAMISRTNGFNALIRFLRPAYLHYTTSPDVVSKGNFVKILSQIKLESEDFDTTNFPPGSSGATRLYNRLMADSGL